MFIVFNRAKINSYLISIGTVMILFSMTFMINKNMDTVETSTLEENINIIKSDEKKLIINSIQNDVNNINIE